MRPVKSPMPIPSTSTESERASCEKASSPKRTSIVALTTRETHVVVKVPCLRAAKVATISAPPQQRATTTASRMPVLSTRLLFTLCPHSPRDRSLLHVLQEAEHQALDCW